MLLGLVALAQHVIHGSYPSNWLLVLETLDQFRTIILTTLKGQAPQNLEYISQLACPTFCLAMIWLLVRSEGGLCLAKKVFASSPWTVELHTELGKLLSPEPTSTGVSSRYCYLREVLGDIGRLLMQVVRQLHSSVGCPVLSMIAFRSQWK